jgi:hypothetical protein
MGIIKDLDHFKLNVDLKGTIIVVTEEPLQEFVNVFI